MDRDKQMEFFFEEGGIADDGMDRDPVSGNEVPPGSLAKEVRDDIPAQLSEGEYVVPADVLRYYGVKFFEDLRTKAKIDLNQMEEKGRIGGDPVPMGGPEEMPLSPEEEAELASIMQMAMGGMAMEQQQQSANPYQQQSTLYAAPKQYNDGGLELPPETIVTPDFSQFLPGFSFMGETPGQNMPVIQPNENVTLYGPNGEVVSVMIPAQQQLYNQYIEEGYTLTQQVTDPVEEMQQQQQSEGDGRVGRDTEQGRGRSSLGSLGKVDFSDPLGDAEDALEGKGKTMGIAGALLGGIIGAPVLGAGVGKAFGQANSVAEATANAEIADLLGFDTTNINSAIDSTINNMNFASRTAARMARDRARAETKSRFYDALKDPTSGIQFSLDRSSFQTDDAYTNTLDELARSVEQSSNLPSGSVVAMGQGTDDEGDQFSRDYSRAAAHAAQNPQGMTTGQGLSSSADIAGYMPPSPGDEPSSASDQAGDGGDSAKIVCTAMNASYGFGSYRQAIWLRYSEKHLTGYHEKGYHKIFLPLVDRAYKRGDKNNKTLRKVLENIARHRTADLRAEMQGKKRDMVGRVYRLILEPLCYIVGRLSK